MIRRRRSRSHANHERWLVSYADFITLLFAFFVVLYASAQVDQRKVGRLAMAIQVAFQELGVFPASGAKIPISINQPSSLNAVAIENVKPSPEGSTPSLSRRATLRKRPIWQRCRQSCNGH